MHEGLVLAERGLAGGVLVVVFALIGEVVRPKVFSGLFSAAPSVAIASLAITIMVEGSRHAKQDSAGMTLGAIGMIVGCLIACSAIPRFKALRASGAAWLGWGAISLGLYALVFSGVR